MKDFIKDLIAKIFGIDQSPGSIEVQNSTYAATRVTVDHPYKRYITDNRLKATDSLNKHSWNLAFLDERYLASQTTTDLIDSLKDVSPEFNRALHDFIQFVVTSYELVVDNPEGLNILEEVIETMSDKKESFITKLEKAASSIFLHGAIFSEVVFDPQGREFSDFVIIDATLVEFRESEDPVDGQQYRLGQMKDGRFVDLQDDPTVDYIAFDSVTGSPFGRSLSAAGIFPALFSLMLMKDLRQVIRTSGYPQKVAQADRQKLYDSGTTDPADQLAIIEKTKEDLINFLSQPAGPYTDTPILGSEWEIKTIEGIRGSNLAAVETLINTIERMMVRAFKTNSVIFGINSSSGLSDNSGTQAEMHYVLIDSIQRKMEQWITRSFEEILRARGNPGNVSFKLKRINTLVNKQRSETEYVNAQTVKMWYDMGAINSQTALDLFRHPDPFGEKDTILPARAPANAERRPDEIIEVDREEESND